MPQPFDITTKRLFDADPRAWLALAGLATSDPITLVDPTLPASSVLADKAARVDSAQPWLSLGDMPSFARQPG